MTKKVIRSVCGMRFPETQAKYEPAKPAVAGIYTLCPKCHPWFIKEYRT